MIEAICSCGERYQVKDGYAGKRVRCLACSGAIAVPSKRASNERRLARSPTVATAPVAGAATPRNRLAGGGAVDQAVLAKRSPARPLATVTPREPAPVASPSPARRATERREAALDWALVVGATVGYALIGALWTIL